jgi:hypothetical protein
MGLFYSSQPTFIIAGSKTAAGVRTGVTLEGTYDGSTLKKFETGSYSVLNLDINYTMGATETSNSIEVKIESSPDGINFYRIPNEAASGGTSTLTAREFTFAGANAAAAPISIRLDIAYKYMRVEFKETGVASNKGNVFCEVTLSGK